MRGVFMSRKKKLVIFIAVAVLICAMLTVTAFAADDGEEYVSNMYSTFWALVPPIIAIVLALITKEVYSALFVGILVGALFYSNFNVVKTLDTIINEGFLAGLADAWNIGIFMFLILLGTMVALINKAGGSQAFGRWAERNIKTKAGALFATFVLGILIFVDDYFNCLTVGSVMRPVTDRHQISRSKLAYIIDATAAPVCMIAPISSWAAAVSGMVDEAEYTGIELFVRAIPYNFYSLLTFVFIIAIILMKFDYGPMRTHEFNAVNGDLFSGEKHEDTEALEGHPNGRVFDLIIPIILLVVFCIIGMIYVGGFFSGETFVDAFGATDASVGLPWGTLIALIITMIYLICRKLITFKEAMACLPKGFIAMVPALLILSCAIALKSVTGLLGASEYVFGLMDSAAQGLVNMLPAVIFLVACVLAFATGTSWGTFGILIPIVTAIFPASSPLMIIGISACLAGAVCGDHCSPISDTTIMSSAGAQCDHVNHVSTQLPYSITVAAVSFVCFIIAGFTKSFWISMPAGIIIMIIVLFIIKGTQKKTA